MSDGITPKVFETLLLQLLFKNQEYQSKILPFLRPDIFDVFEAKEVVTHILDFQEKYNKFPNIPELKVLIKNKDTYTYLVDSLAKEHKEYDEEFIKDEVEYFFKDKLLNNELFTTLEALKKGDEDSKASAPDRIREAISFSFDTSVGLDIFEDGETLYESLHEVDSVIPSGIRNIDKLIKGGFHEKSLTMFLAETNMGKSLIKTALATNCLMQNKNVLYISLEMSETKISERILANLFDTELNDLHSIPKDRFINTFQKVKETINNRLVIKEFPTRSANTNKIRNLLKELELKKKFKPDIIFLDYLGIMIPNSFNKINNSNTEMKIISEELRGLAMEYSLPIVSSIQTNRGGFGEMELDLTDVADSIGVTNTGDVIFAVAQSDEMRTAGRYLFRLVKNRYGINKVQCMVGVDYPKMRLYEVSDDNENSEQSGSQAPKLTSHGKPKTPKGTESTTIVDESAVKVLSTLKENKITDRKRMFGNTTSGDENDMSDIEM